MTPHFSEDKPDDFGAAVAQFRRALERRVDAHLKSHPYAGAPRVARAAAPRPSTRPWALGMAVGLVIVAIGGAIVWPRGVRVYAAGDDGLQLTLADNSGVEMRAHSELTVGRASDGIRIDLKKGDIIVTAAEQRDGHLYVRTKDMTIAVVGTVFLVNASQDGSRVAVIEGEVRVREGNMETRLRPGEQVSTSPMIARRPVVEDITWSRQADALRPILESFTRGMAQTAGTLMPVARAQDAPGVGAQASPQFEEASIRECDPDNLPPTPAGARGGGANSLQMTPGRLYALCLTPATLIRTAYGYSPANISGRGGRGLPMKADIVYGLGVEDGLRVRGGPDWVRTQFYTIEAVAGSPADAETMRGPMLRALLELRFLLKAHVETEQIPAFALTVAPGGLKMKEGTCPPADPSAVRLTPQDTVRRYLEAARRGTTTIPCGLAGGSNGPNMVFIGGGAGAIPLGGILGVPVINQTGIPPTTRFNYVLEFAPDERTAGPMGRLVSNEPSDIPRAPDIFTALEEQLGLKLEPARAPREFIVIDAIQRPSGN